jgi:RimJ/RimL family protein N-acetyltransferase
VKKDIIEGSAVRLRPFQGSDADELAAACADPLTQRFIPAMPNPFTHDDARWWITEGCDAAWAAGGAAYAIADPDTDHLLGGIGIGQLMAVRGLGEIGYWVAPWARRRGVATAATTALATRALDAGFARLELLTEVENAASQRVALAAGFRREGVRRGAGAARDGGRYDLVAWVRLADDPPAPAPRILPDLPGGALTDGVVTVCPLTPLDSEFLHGLHTLPDVVAGRVPPLAPQRAETDLRCAHAEAQWLAGERAALVIVDTASGQAAGGCALFYDDPQTRQAMLGYSMLPAWRGRGLATRAVRMLAHWALGPAGINRLAAGTLPGNLGSRRVLEKVGFRREGHVRGRLPGPDGRRVDVVQFGLLPQDLPR